jgi:hypothetical protein
MQYKKRILTGTHVVGINITLELVYRLKLSFTQVKEHTIDFVELPVQSVHITTKFVSSNPIHVKVYSIQHYVIKFVSDLQQVGGFLRVSRFPQPIKLTAIVESGLKYHKPNLHVITERILASG